jgi:LCP family protein required for cell wall assembly
VAACGDGVAGADPVVTAKGSTTRDDGRPPTLPRALLVVASAVMLPGLGHLLLGRSRTGGAIMAAFLLGATGLGLAAARADRADLLQSLVSTPVLITITVVCALVALAWTATVVRTYVLARPRPLRATQRVVGVGVVVAMCAAVVVPLGFVGDLANSQRALLDEVFAAGPEPEPAGGAQPSLEPPNTIAQPRLNILLLGSDAAPDRDGTRTDTMIVASVDTRTAEIILFALPRNIQRAPFPPGSAMARRFPEGFHDPTKPTSGTYLLNAVYAYGAAHPDLAPAGPTPDPGVNLLVSTITEMLGLRLDHYVAVDMAGLAAVVDALGGLTVDVGPVRLPIGGVTPSGRRVEPEGYLEPGVQHLDGYEALWFARSRRNSDDYDRMRRQRCLIDAVLTQNSPTELLVRFRSIAAATSGSVRTDIPRSLLPALVTLVDEHDPLRLRTISFDPELPAPTEPGGSFRPARPDVAYMRKVVSEATSGPPPSAAPSSGTPTSGVQANEARTSEIDTGQPARPPVEPAPVCPGAATRGG